MFILYILVCDNSLNCQSESKFCCIWLKITLFKCMGSQHSYRPIPYKFYRSLINFFRNPIKSFKFYRNPIKFLLIEQCSYIFDTKVPFFLYLDMGYGTVLATALSISHRFGPEPKSGIYWKVI